MAIYHIARVADWEKAKEAGEYRMSTRGRTLDQQGFIHASDLHQVVPTANLIYPDDDAATLVVLVIDPAELGPGIVVRYEDVPRSPDPFPHIFGPIRPEAVTGTLALRKGEDGRFLLI